MIIPHRGKSQETKKKKQVLITSVLPVILLKKISDTGYNPLKTNDKKTRLPIMVIGGLILSVALIWIFIERFESEKPSFELGSPLSFINSSQSVFLTVSDRKSGLRHLWIGLLADGQEKVLLDKQYPGDSLLRGGLTQQDHVDLLIEPKKINIPDGKGIFRIVISDYSWKSWGSGNRTYQEIPVVIDTRPPEVEVLSSVHNLTQGGAGLVIYRISENSPQHGIYVNGNFFPGYTGYFKNPLIAMAFIALDIQLPDQPEVYVTASDMAGNAARAGFPYYIRKQSFKKDIIRLTDSFLNWKMPELAADVSSESETPMIDKFLKVNRELRQENYKEFIAIGRISDPEIYWKGEFLRLPGSARQANFADFRDYQYNGTTIDHQIHQGIDLASVPHSPVPAANRGKVAFAGTIGIYGKTVIIDHGFGLFSTYSHLSGYNVEKGRVVEKGEIIGRTGTTGMAGGDHLHFGILVHVRFVNPVEWWDPVWLKNNIQSKIDTIASRYP